MTSDTPRRVVLENLLLAGFPLAPSDNDFDASKLPVEKGPRGLEAHHNYEGIRARLTIAIDETGTPNVRADKLIEVHYHLLAIAALSEYEDSTVFYTNRGLAKDMGWSDNGESLKRVRDAVDRLWASTLEFEGELPDPLVPGRINHQTQLFRILTGRAFPKEEERRSGIGRNMSWVQYNPNYLQSIKNDPSVQLDVELLSQIRGTLAKAFYRTAGWLRGTGTSEIPLDELFHRTGSSRQRVSGSHAERFFGPAWDMMLEYRYLRSRPDVRKNDRGEWWAHFDWGEPIFLPGQNDILYRTLIGEGVNPTIALQMIRHDERKARRILIAARQGALGRPRTTPAAQIYGLFKDPEWDIVLEQMSGDQMDMLNPPSEGFTVEVRETATVDWENALDWVAAEKANGTWDDFVADILIPALRCTSERNPDTVLTVGDLGKRLREAFSRLDWTTAVRALYGAETHLTAVKYPVSYLITVFENEAVASSASNVSEAQFPSRPTPKVKEQQPEPRSQEGTGKPISIKDLIPETVYLESWITELLKEPSKASARSALRFCESKTAGEGTTGPSELLSEIESIATAIMDGESLDRFVERYNLQE